MPGDFIHAAEESGVILELGRWVLETACSQGAAWHAQGHDVSISVNVSARQLAEPGFQTTVAAALAASGFDPGHLILEITETVLMQDTERTAIRLAALKEIGVRLAIDDFGTGYSSLAYLQQFPVDAIKIDQTFISGIARSREAKALIHTFVQLGKTLGLETVAEGIEDDAQLHHLREEQCVQRAGIPAGAAPRCDRRRVLPVALARGVATGEMRDGAEVYGAEVAVAVPATLRSDLLAGATLPASWYSDPELLRLEHERIFNRSWQYAGVLEQVTAPGAFFTCRVGDVPIVVVRDRSGELRAFVNVCRHRGHEVAQGCGQRETLQCPYHAWTYGLDGELRTAPRSDREPGFDRSEWSLLPAQVDTWGPLVFVNPDLAAAPLAETLGELPARWRRAASTRPPSPTAAARVSGWSTRTGRSWSRTSSSATTAPSPTRASAG